MKVLILGGYGTFGGRLADLIRDDSRLTVIIAGRSREAAETFCASRQMPGHAQLLPEAFDRRDWGAVLRRLKPDLVVDASGPFQVYGEDPYRVARGAIAAGADYMDLADGTDFVTGIATLDEAAKAAGRFVLSGMSSFPVLSTAVVRRLAQDLDEVRDISAGNRPVAFAGVGLNVIRAIASYSGKPVNVLIDGAWTTHGGFFDSRRMTVNVPGKVPLPPIRFALADVPDLQILPREWPEVRSVWVGAGPTPAFLHRLLWLAAGLVKLRIVPSLLPWAPVMNWVVNRVRWGEHRGGMVVEIKGAWGGGAVKASWHLLAEGDAGPLIPSMAADAIIRHCLGGKRPAPGARPGHRDLELTDYEPLLAKHGIATGFRIEGHESCPPISA